MISLLSEFPLRFRLQFCFFLLLFFLLSEPQTESSVAEPHTHDVQRRYRRNPSCRFFPSAGNETRGHLSACVYTKRENVSTDFDNNAGIDTWLRVC